LAPPHRVGVPSVPRLDAPYLLRTTSVGPFGPPVATKLTLSPGS
jgi:hypothetical protein